MRLEIISGYKQAVWFRVKEYTGRGKYLSMRLVLPPRHWQIRAISQGRRGEAATAGTMAPGSWNSHGNDPITGSEIYDAISGVLYTLCVAISKSPAFAA